MYYNAEDQNQEINLKEGIFQYDLFELERVEKEMIKKHPHLTNRIR